MCSRLKQISELKRTKITRVTQTICTFGLKVKKGWKQASFETQHYLEYSKCKNDNSAMDESLSHQVIQRQLLDGTAFLLLVENSIT